MKSLICNRIPAFFEGRGILPSANIQVKWRQIEKDYVAGLCPVQRRGKYKRQGPLYELQASSDYSSSIISNPELTFTTPTISFDRVQVVMRNLVPHPVTERPVSATFVLQPSEEAMKIRVPLRYLNEEKCVGLTDGWLNRLHRSVEVRVPPHVNPPLSAELDIGGMKVKEKKFARDVRVPEPGSGYEIILPPPDTLVLRISKR